MTTTEFLKYEGGRLIIPAGHFGTDKDAIEITENFLDEEDLKAIYEYAKIANTDYQGGPKGKLKNRIHEAEVFRAANEELYNLFKTKYYAKVRSMLEDKHKLKLSEAFKCNGQHSNTAKDLVNKINYMAIVSQCGCMSESQPYIAVWREGDDQQDHVDNNEFTALIYINDDYEGGEINFIEQEISLRPKAGTLIVWPGYIEHSVNAVTAGTRYTMPMFLKAVDVIE